jgi:hypothetical protein
MVSWVLEEGAVTSLLLLLPLVSLLQPAGAA